MSSRTVRRRHSLPAVVAMVLIAALVLSVVVVGAGLLWTAVRDLFVETQNLGTLLQVVPATVVAVFVFAAGTVFVIAQVIHTPLGSRSVEELLRSGRVRGVLVAGVVLLMASLVIVVIAPGDGHECSGSPATDPPCLVAAAGTALAVATVLYAPISIALVVAVLATFVHPRDYTERLVDRDGPLSGEEIYHRLRALRQWLRISCASGESRDITFALLGMHKLIRKYVSGAPGLRKKVPSEYDDTQIIVTSHWRTPAGTAVVGDLPGWFGAELGRAFSRSLETGLLQNTLLVRDADRIIGEMRWAWTLFVDRGLFEEAGYLIDRIAEIGHIGRLVGSVEYRSWCGKAATKVLWDAAAGWGGQRCEAPQRHGSRAPAGQRVTYELRSRAVAGLALVIYEMSRSSTDRPLPPGPPCGANLMAHLWLRWLERNRFATGSPSVFVGAQLEVPEVDELVEWLVDDVSWIETDTLAPSPQSREEAIRRLKALVRALSQLGVTT